MDSYFFSGAFSMEKMDIGLVLGWRRKDYEK